LRGLDGQETSGLFRYSIVVADNDASRSAESVVSDCAARSTTAIKYCVEPQQNIALARNKAVANAAGDFVAFIDDDEFPVSNWLLALLAACNEHKAAGVLGPVKPYFEHEPPEWVTKGAFFERPRHRTGYIMPWPDARTGNVLLRRTTLDCVEGPFSAKFGTGGEDVDFFRRATEKGCTFIWCDEAVVHEIVPVSRCCRTYLLKRALLRGSNSSKYPSSRLWGTVKSIIAVPLYTLGLPLLAVLGHHWFIKYLIKLCDHVARLLALMGWQVVRERQM
jgi:GT2 family glycosyltransferase